MIITKGTPFFTEHLQMLHFIDQIQRTNLYFETVSKSGCVHEMANLIVSETSPICKTISKLLTTYYCKIRKGKHGDSVVMKKELARLTSYVRSCARIFENATPHMFPQSVNKYDIIRVWRDFVEISDDLSLVGA
jgi:hypothetical protein